MAKSFGSAVGSALQEKGGWGWREAEGPAVGAGGPGVTREPAAGVQRRGLRAVGLGWEFG